MATIESNRYGKTLVRLMQVDRRSTLHQVREVSVAVLLEGEFDAVYREGDNSRVLPTDTMKNTVYVVAQQSVWDCIEALALQLAAHFLEGLPQVSKVLVKMEQIRWVRMGKHPAAFQQGGDERRTVDLEMTRAGSKIVSGLKGLQILKTAHSGFAGFLKDQLTTLPDTSDRMLGTVLEADWTFQDGNRRFAESNDLIKETMLNVFAEHQSLSVQHTLFAMGREVLEKVEAVSDIHLVMPNKHCLLFDLARFGLENANEIFVPTDEPSGYIEARLTR